MSVNREDELVLWGGIASNGQYDICSVVEDEKGLRLKLVSENDGSLLELYWDCLGFGYKNVDESFWMDTLDKLIGLYGDFFITQHTFFVVRHSSYAQELEQGGKETIKKEQMFHLKIISSNSIFDIVSWGEPKIRTGIDKEKEGLL